MLQDDRRTSREYELNHQCLQLMRRLDPNAARHVYHGVIQRVLMLQAGRIFLLKEADPADRSPRGIYMASELSLHANAYYLNLRGGLDNLAWCLHYQFSLIPGTDERDGKRMSIYLFGQKFQDALTHHLPELVASLKKKSDWANDLSERRDPAAHRIPLQVPRTIFSEDDARRSKEIDAQVAELVRSGKHSEGMELSNSTSSLGTFEALLVQATPEGPVYVALHPQVGRDHDHFLDVAEAVVTHLSRAVPDKDV